MKKSYGIRKSLRERGMESERMLKLFAHVRIDCQEFCCRRDIKL